VIYVVIHLYVVIHQFLATDYADFDIGFDMYILVELLELECTNFVIVIFDDIALVFIVQQNLVWKEQTLSILHVDDDNLAKDDIAFTYPSFRRRPPAYETLDIHYLPQLDHLPLLDLIKLLSVDSLVISQ